MPWLEHNTFEYWQLLGCLERYSMLPSPENLLLFSKQMNLSSASPLHAPMHNQFLQLPIWNGIQVTQIIKAKTPRCINLSCKSWNCIIKCESDVDWSNLPFSCPATCFWLFADIVEILHSVFTTYLSYTIWFHKLVFFFNCHIFFCCNLLLYCQIFKSLQLYLQTQCIVTCPIFLMLHLWACPKFNH